MAVITPSTDVILLKVPLEMSENNQLTFANATAQYNYFNSLPKLVFDNNFTYQRKDGVMRVPALYDDIMGYNYVMYRNNAYDNKWFYAFIENAEYVNDEVTALSLKSDVWQCWQFDLHYKPVFVEREHVNDDTVGLHTMPENLELGEYVQNGNIVNSDLRSSGSESNACYICFQVSDYPTQTRTGVSPAFPTKVTGHKVGGVYSGLDYIMVLTTSDANNLIACYDADSKSEAIVSIFSVPLGAINADNMSIVNRTSDYGSFTTSMFNSDSSVPIALDTITIAKPTTLDGYTPVNGKMKTFPFCYFYMSNNAGYESEFHWEDFSSTPSFNVEGVISQGMSIKAYPTNYKKGSNKDGYTFGIPCGKLPVCAWNTDYYVNWCTQNAINQPMSVFSSLTSGALGLGAGVASGNPLSALSSGISAFEGIVNAVDRRYQASLVPDQARGNVNCGDVNLAETRFGYTLYPMSIKSEYAVICDQFMSMYGYRVNTVKIPNITGRRNWNFVKTIGCYIEADIPESDLSEIKSFFDKGITFWHNPATFADYSQNNDII